MVEMGKMVSMKFKGEYPSVDLLCRRTIQRCKDNAAESKERKLEEAKRATDATLERVGSLRIGGSAPKETVKSPARVKPRLSAEDQEEVINALGAVLPVDRKKLQRSVDAHWSESCDAKHSCFSGILE